MANDIHYSKAQLAKFGNINHSDVLNEMFNHHGPFIYMLDKTEFVEAYENMIDEMYLQDLDKLTSEEEDLILMRENE